MAYDSIAALADPTRRRVFELIADRPRPVAEIARALAVSQHLKVLKAARLVRAEPRGASNVYHIDPRGLAEMRAWLDRMWGEALAAFERECRTEDGR